MLNSRKLPSNSSILDKKFVSLTDYMELFLRQVKKTFDDFDKSTNDNDKRLQFIESRKRSIFSKLDDYFAKAWDIVKDFDKDRYALHRKYCQNKLFPLLEESIEINRHIHRKPLGYAGDYLMMNYIYDYNGNRNYLGNSSYENLINNYTCNIPFSCSNIKRKEFLKEKIMEFSLRYPRLLKVLSVASGSARELIELLEEGKINTTLSFKCLDFEKQALDYVKGEIEKIPFERKKMLSVEYIQKDIISVIKNKEFKKTLLGQDLIYVSGLFDYLSERIAARLTQELYGLLNKAGRLIVCNASLDNNSHRAYYELLGEWHMIYRTKNDMLRWTKKLNAVKKISFADISNNSYLFLVIDKE